MSVQYSAVLFYGVILDYATIERIADGRDLDEFFEEEGIAFELFGNLPRGSNIEIGIIAGSRHKTSTDGSIKVELTPVNSLKVTQVYSFLKKYKLTAQIGWYLAGSIS
jgi:hypothetical protein